MNYRNASELANSIAGIHNTQTKNREFENIANALNAIRRNYYKVVDLNAEILAEKNKPHPSLLTLLSLRRTKRRVLDDGVIYMSKVNKIAHNYDIEKIFSGHISSFPFLKRNGYLMEAKEYELAVSENVINNSFVHHNPNIESAENDNKYLHLLIKGFEERTKEITPEKQIQNVNEKEQAEHKRENKSITKAKTTNDLDKIIRDSKEKEKANERVRKDKTMDKKKEKKNDEPEL